MVWHGLALFAFLGIDFSVVVSWPLTMPCFGMICGIGLYYCCLILAALLIVFNFLFRRLPGHFGGRPINFRNVQEKIERVKREFEESRHGHFGSRWINFKNLRVKIEREPSEVKLRAEREPSEVIGAEPSASRARSKA